MHDYIYYSHGKAISYASFCYCLAAIAEQGLGLVKLLLLKVF